MPTRSGPYRARATVERDLAEVVDAIAEVLSRGGAPRIPPPRWGDADADEADEIEPRPPPPPGRWRGRFEGRCDDDPGELTADRAAPPREAQVDVGWIAAGTALRPDGARHRAAAPRVAADPSGAKQRT